MGSGIRLRFHMDRNPGRHRRKRFRRCRGRAYRRLPDRQVRPYRNLQVQPAGLRRRRVHCHDCREPAHGCGGRCALRPFGRRGCTRFLELHFRNLHFHQARFQHRHQPVRLELRPCHHLHPFAGYELHHPRLRGRRHHAASRRHLWPVRRHAGNAHPVPGPVHRCPYRLEPPASAAGIFRLGREERFRGRKAELRQDDGHGTEEPREREDHHLPGCRVPYLEPCCRHERPVHAVSLRCCR